MFNERMYGRRQRQATESKKMNRTKKIIRDNSYSALRNSCALDRNIEEFCNEHISMNLKESMIE